MEELRQVMKDLAMLRFADLRRLEIVNNRVTLGRWIDTLGFPAGVMLGPNTRAWKAVDVKQWLDQRAADSSGRSRKRGQDVSRRRFGLEFRA